MEIMKRGQPEIGQLPGDIKMAKVCSRVGAAGRAGAVGINGPAVLFELQIFDIYVEFVLLRSTRLRREQEASPASDSGGRDAIEGIDSSGHTFKYVVDLAYA